MNVAIHSIYFLYCCSSRILLFSVVIQANLTDTLALPGRLCFLHWMNHSVENVRSVSQQTTKTSKYEIQNLRFIIILCCVSLSLSPSTSERTIDFTFPFCTQKHIEYCRYELKMKVPSKWKHDVISINVRSFFESI